MSLYLKKLLEVVGLDQSHLPILENNAEKSVDILKELLEYVEAEENP